VEPPAADARAPRPEASPAARLGGMVHTAWPARLAWLALPLVMGPAIGDALAGNSRSVQLVASVGAWLAWLGIMVATLVPTTVSLTALRIAAPGAVLGAVAALVDVGVTAWSVAGVVWALATALVALAPETSEVFVDGSSYGEERRLPLTVPASLLAGPAELAWAAVVAGLAAGPLLLAAEHWVAGAVALAVGLPAALWGARVLHTLARRWLVFVPAGVVVHDQLALVDPILLRRGVVAAVEPAPADTAARDLTAGAAGLALEIRLTRPVSILPVARRGVSPELVEATALLVSPSRPGRVLAEARRRRLG
jgi:hypothetical protein